jgi:TonB family protein
MLRAIEPVAFHLARLMLALPLALSLAPIAGAQQMPMAPVGIRLAEAIAQSKEKSVVVFDFSGPDKKVTQLGEELASDLSAELARSSGNIQVKQESEIGKDYYEPGTMLDPESMLLFARDIKAKTFVMGQISLSGSNALILIVSAYRSDSGKRIAALKVTSRLTEEMASSMAKIVADNYPNAGTAGYSSPKCGYCPRADYSEEAMKDKLRGVVELTVIVGTDGRPRNISVSKGLPGGLTMQAIKAVRQWKLVPATGPDGKPAAVRQIIEVAFEPF